MKINNFRKNLNSVAEQVKKWPAWKRDSMTFPKIKTKMEKPRGE